MQSGLFFGLQRLLVRAPFCGWVDGHFSVYMGQALCLLGQSETDSHQCTIHPSIGSLLCCGWTPNEPKWLLKPMVSYWTGMQWKCVSCPHTIHPAWYVDSSSNSTWAQCPVTLQIKIGWRQIKTCWLGSVSKMVLAHPFLHSLLRLVQGEQSLTPSVDWLDSLIAPVGCYQYSPPICTPSFSFMGGVRRK
jgi:hypothetical protein